MATLSKRVDKLEAAVGHGRRSMSLVIQHCGETQQQALQRWRAGHPGEDLSPAGVIVVRLV
jgi:hypothetical protein